MLWLEFDDGGRFGLFDGVVGNVERFKAGDGSSFAGR